ncbi:hypothetical protein [Pseudonocardia sp. TMWB2A]|uniref:hypothetical protein n=1 Tax=Pseudonocardia sp. TMWB2A TaxID=687430 RepID=UPI00307E8CE1
MLGFILRVLNGFIISIRGAEGDIELDAQGMYYMMRDAVRSGRPIEYSYGVDFHVNSTAKFLDFVGDDIFWACFLPAFYWLAGAIFFLKSLELLKPSTRDRMAIVLLYALLPGCFYFTSIPLRESMQLMGVNIAVWGAMQVVVRSNPLGWLFLLAGSVVAALLHGVLAIVGLALVVGTFTLVPMIRNQKLTGPRQFLVLVMVIILMPFAFSGLKLVGYNVEDGALDAAAQYQAGGLSEEARSNYKQTDAAGGVVANTVLVPVSLIQYLVEPMPWRIGTASDLYLFMENMLRLLCLFIGVRIWQKSKGRECYLQGGLVIIYLFHETIWALGTVNWGTAMRHHVPITGVQLLMVARFSVLQKEKTALRKNNLAPVA